MIVGHHDLPRGAQIGAAWADSGKRGLVVQANLATDSGGDRPSVDEIREHRRNGGVFIQRLDWTWDDTLPRPDQARAWAIQCDLFLRGLQGEVDYVQLGNEPDLAHRQRGELTPEQHSETFGIVARALSGYKCTYAPIGWLGWASRMHPADYMRRFYTDLTIRGNDGLVAWVPFHSYDQQMGWDVNAYMRDIPGVFYSRRIVENQIDVLPNWAKGLPRYWVECNPIANPDAGEWQDNHAAFIADSAAYAAAQGMAGIAYFRLWRGYASWGRDYGYADRGAVMAAIRQAQVTHQDQIAAPFVPPVAAINERYHVTSDMPFLRVRSSAEITDNNIIGFVKNGDVVGVNSIVNGWAEITLGAGGVGLFADEALSTRRVGFVRSSLLQEVIS